MTEQHPYRTPITPLADGNSRPLWSVMIPTYNCANYLRETLTSVLAQDPGPEIMQIEVIDDHSTKDDPEAVVKELGQGRVSFYRQPENVRHVKNFNTCIQRARGKLIHILHGDDSVQYGFYKKMQAAFDMHPELGAAFCRHIYIDEQSHWRHVSGLLQLESGFIDNWLEKIVCKQHIQTPSIVVQREVYEKLGGFDSRFEFYFEDWEMWVRIATQYPIWYETEPLAKYRVGSMSNSGHTIKTGKNAQEVRKGLDIVKSYLPNYLPKNTADRLLNKHRKNFAKYAIKTAYQMLMIGKPKVAFVQIKEAFRCSLSLEVITWLFYLFSKESVRRILSQSRTI